MSFQTVMLAVLANTAEQVEETTLEAGLEELYAKDPAEWEATCEAATVFGAKLSNLPGVSKSKFLSALVEGVGVAVQESEDLHPTTGK